MKLVDVIKYEGDNSTFVWKHPREDFNTGSQLIVHESQEAVFFLNGEALDVFGPGRHTLETQNIPKLAKLFNKTTGGETPFHCEVYFVNKTVQMSIKWGTDSKVRFIEPTLGIPLEIGASGELNLMVADPMKLLVKLVGTMSGVAWDERGANFTKSLSASFRPLISTAVKSHLVAAIKSENLDILEIDENLAKLSEVLRKNITPGFEEYGMTIPQFYITNVLLPEGDPNFKRMRDMHTVALQTKYAQAEALVKSAQADAEAEVTVARRRVEMEHQKTETEVARHQAERDLIRAQAEAQAAKMSGFAEAEVMAAKGYTQRDVLQADVQRAYAEGLGNMHISGGGGAGDVIGIGVGLAAAGAIAPQVGEMFKGLGTPTAPAAEPAAKCAKCGATLPANAKFCLECGEKVVSASGETVACPDCGKTVPKGKFCPECGHKFLTNCPKCGAAIVPGSKFCPDCGEKL